MLRNSKGWVAFENFFWEWLWSSQVRAGAKHGKCKKSSSSITVSTCDQLVWSADVQAFIQLTSCSHCGGISNNFHRNYRRRWGVWELWKERMLERQSEHGFLNVVDAESAAWLYLCFFHFRGQSTEPGSKSNSQKTAGWRNSLLGMQSRNLHQRAHWAHMDMS